jgi:hypothetical protein
MSPLNTKIKILIIFTLFLIILYSHNNFTLNSEIINLDEIIIIIKKFLNPNSIPILNENEKIAAEYWKSELFCPFSKLTSHGLTKKEALLIIDFFKIESISDLKKLEEFLKEYN